MKSLFTILLLCWAIEAKIRGGDPTKKNNDLIKTHIRNRESRNRELRGERARRVGDERRGGASRFNTILIRRMMLFLKTPSPSRSTTPAPAVTPNNTNQPTPTRRPTLTFPPNFFPPRVCPTSVSSDNQVEPGNIPCQVNEDCKDFQLPGGQNAPLVGRICCVSPFCVCGVSTAGLASAVGCVTDTATRTPTVPTPNPTVRPTPPPFRLPSDPQPSTTSQTMTLSPVDGPTRQPRVTIVLPPIRVRPPPTPAPASSSRLVCPSPVSGRFQSSPTTTPCNTNEDCKDFVSVDGDSCCLHPFCICGDSRPGAGGVQCVESLVRTGSGPTDLIPVPPTPVPTPPQPTPIPTPSPMESSTLSPQFVLRQTATSPPNTPAYFCPSPISGIYQSIRGTTPCDKNSDCKNMADFDGEQCCLHPRCICGTNTTTSEGNVRCATDPP